MAENFKHSTSKLLHKWSLKVYFQKMVAYEIFTRVPCLFFHLPLNENLINILHTEYFLHSAYEVF